MRATIAANPTQGRKLRADAQRNYDTLVAVARQAFSEHGANASLDDIAKRAGVGPGTLYRHFPSRADLHLAVLQDWRDEVEAEGRRLAAIEDDEQVLDEWLRRYVDYKNFFRGLHEALLEDNTDEERPALNLCKEQLSGISRDVIDRAKAAGLVREDVDAKTVCQMLSGIAFLVDRSPAGTVDVETQIKIIRAGIRPAA
ncbi:TetR/AcrR family transcriptional regulator [Microlunatus soli]|uniref:DNA-binding transcriptional regulator, AcrR family n=1 Tax=Microlunatus soli TaxID=630515 RepID=A0A1H1RPD9_9ACTN|nr:TetR/AcrR family transcriptional regulator [Microlunatus soli]SDS37564.1 DNA-binding transcriptional regulator, AcrR family [Microlunatus soli]